jgi:phosphoribosylanthranilate isomerase
MWIKICGICDLQSAQTALGAGADAIGLNFIPRSKRLVTVEQAQSIANGVRGRVELVGVMEDVALDRAKAVMDEIGLNRIQLHFNRVGGVAGLEMPEWAYVAVGLSAPDDVRRLQEYAGDPLLVDACVGGKSGGTGATFDWNWVVGLAEHRRIVLAGGLTPENVQDAIARVHPWGVDVASGVELSGSPRVKDPERVAQFIMNARNASRS